MENRVVLITGGGSGVGFSIAEELLKEGFKVSICGRNEEKLKNTGLKLIKISPNIFIESVDISKKEQVHNWVSNVLKRFGRIDILVNNAGVSFPKVFIEDITDEVLDSQFDTNVKGALYCSQEVLPQMKERSRGHIFNISSICGKKGFSGEASYSISKFGLSALSDSLREEYFQYNIKVTTLYPGRINTAFVPIKGFNEEDLIQPLDIAKTILYILSLSKNTLINEVILNRRRINDT